MRIKVLGVGGAFSPELGNSSFIIEDGDMRMLVDCGYTVYPELKRLNLIDDLTHIFISHTHGDHAGSLDTLLYHRRFVTGKPITLIGNIDVNALLRAIDTNFLGNEVGEYLTEYIPIEYFKRFPNKHINGMLSYGFRYKDFVFSGDTKESILGNHIVNDATIIFHEVSFGDYPDNVHTYYGKLVDAPAHIKKATYLYHYNTGEHIKYQERVEADGFAGFLLRNV